MEVQPDTMPWTSVYKLMTGAIVPRPIGWISTLGPSGIPNLAPFSFFNMVSSNPPHVVFAPVLRRSDRSEKDTLQNVRSSGEFVVNIVSEPLAAAMNQTATELPDQVNEFAYAGLTPAASSAVQAPRVAESLVHFECKLAHLLELGDQPGSGSLVVGRVVWIHVADEVLGEEGKIDIQRLRPIGRLTGSAYCRVSDTFELPRPASQLPRQGAG